MSAVTEEFAFAVECSPAALPGIRRRRARVLFGKKTEIAVHVLASRPFPFPCVSTGGYALSEEQEAKLERLLRSCEWDAGLRGMIPVGWYIPGAEPVLSGGDEALFDRFFPEPWQITLVETLEGVFYCFRGIDGAICSDSFPIAPPRKTVWPRRAAFAAAVLLAALALALWRPATRNVGAPHAQRGIGLRVSDKAGQLNIRWERSPEVQAAAGAALEIEDGGGHLRVPLDRTDLLAGSVFYSRWSERVRVRIVLDLRGAAPIEESVAFAAPLASPVAAPAPPAPEIPQPKIKEPPPVLDVPVRVRGEADRVEPRAEPPKLQFRAPRAGLRETPQAMMDAPALPVVPPAPRMAPLATRPRSVPAAEKPPETRAKGRIIWTGKLERRGVLEIDGRRATPGYLSGALPQTPADITVLPGELTATGLRLYTADSRLADRVEPAGPQNGWNRTEYVWDPLRAKEVSVLESPGRQNEWRRLVLRAEGRAYSLVVVQWQARP